MVKLTGHQMRALSTIKRLEFPGKFTGFSPSFGLRKPTLEKLEREGLIEIVRDTPESWRMRTTDMGRSSLTPDKEGA